MEQRPDQGNQISPEIIAQMRDEMERAKEYELIDILDGIRIDYGIGWAIYCSSFMGREVDVWRVNVCEALNA
jgi:hypothetical protein